MDGLRFIVASRVRERINSNGKQASPEFLLALDDLVRRAVDKSCSIHNGGHTRLTASVLGHATGK